MTPPQQSTDLPPARARIPIPSQIASASQERNIPGRHPQQQRQQARQFRYHEVLDGKYRLEKSLARGGMGWVFLATQLPLDRLVAIKILMPQPEDSAFKQRFLLEASTCSKLSHPNIVTVHDYGETLEGDVYMAMEYLDGLSLSQAISKEGQLSPLRSLRIAINIARALRSAHRAGVVHRDLKPSNVMLIRDHDNPNENDQVKVVDFGLAKILDGHHISPVEITHEGVLLGSPRYMAPEQIRNQEIDPRTDIYALGIICYFMLIGSPPFDGDNSTDILTQHLRDTPPSMSKKSSLQIPTELDRFVQRCLTKKPEGRYQVMDEVLVELMNILEKLDTTGTSGCYTGDLLTGMFMLRTPQLRGDTLFVPPTTSGEHANMYNSGVEMASITRTNDSNGMWWAAAVILLSVVGALIFWAYVVS
ncbi:MAG: serine/threonine protein kinase [Myxococcales bacterium]|nr:serine/threonine protein kinase [Myxococcales bacterium]